MDYMKKLFAILLVITATWFLYVLYFQVSIKSLVLIIGCLIIVKAIITDARYIKNFFIKLLLVTVVLGVVFYGTEHLDAEDIKQKQYYDALWGVFSEKKLHEHITNGDLVFVDVTAEWCLICKVNKLRVLDTNEMLDYFGVNGVQLLRADFTNYAPSILQYISKMGRKGIPVYVVYGSKNRQGIVLDEWLTIEKVKEAIEKVKR